MKTVTLAVLAFALLSTAACSGPDFTVASAESQLSQSTTPEATTFPPVEAPDTASTFTPDAGVLPAAPDAGPTFPDAGQALPDAGQAQPDVAAVQPDVAAVQPEAVPPTAPTCVSTQDAEGFVFSTGDLNFGDVVVGQSVTWQVTVDNRGQCATTVTALQLAAGPASGFSVASDCAVLDPGQSCNASVTFAPLLVGKSLVQGYFRDPGTNVRVHGRGCGRAQTVSTKRKDEWRPRGRPRWRYP